MNTKRSSRKSARGRLAWLAWLLWCPLLAAQSVDDGFAPEVDNGLVRVLHEQGNGLLLMGGSFTSAEGATHNRLVRVLPDGTLDSGFAPDIGSGTVPTIWALHQQPSTVPGQGRILIGGQFQQVNGQPRSNLARLNVNGTLDTAFNVSVDGQVRSFDSTMSPDGTAGIIYLGGLFSNVGGIPRPRLAAIQANGTVLATFNPPLISGGLVSAVRLHRDQTGATHGLLVAGAYNMDGEVARLRRVHQGTGALDTGFNVTVSGGTTFGNIINALAVQPDGKILIAGDFDVVNGQTRTMIARLNVDGSLDDSFVPPTLDGGIMGVSLQPDGRMLIAGDFTLGAVRSGIARLNEDGSLDATYAAQIDPDQPVGAVLAHTDGTATFAGGFTIVSGLPRARVARLNTSGTIDQSLITPGSTNGGVMAIAVQDDGKILAGGVFTEFNGHERHRIVRLHPGNGAVDSGFTPGFGISVYAIAVMPDRRILVGGAFNSVSGVTRRRLAMLHPDGSVDVSFNAQIADGNVVAIVPQKDGRILIGGDFTEIAGVIRQSVARLHPDGSLDTSFLPPTSNGMVRAIAVQADGRVVIGGDFTTMGGGWTRNHLARLKANGNMDSVIAGTAGANGAVRAIAQDRDGNLIIGGAFTQVDGSTRNRIAALDADGELLATFSSGANNTVWSIVPRIDGSVYVAGAFTSIGGTARGRVARLSSTGALMPDFDGNADNLVRAMTVQPDGKVLIGGTFETVDGQSRDYLARLAVPQAVRHELRIVGTVPVLQWLWQGPAAEILHPPQLQVSIDCCDHDSFIPFPGTSEMSGGALGNQRVYSLADFTGLSGVYYLRTATVTGDARGAGTHVQYSPAWRFDGGPASDIIFANGFD